MAHMTANIFQTYELEAYLGEFVDDYDVEAIIDEVTCVDYRDGNRYWIELDEDEMWSVVKRHEKSTVTESACSTGNR